MVIGPNANNNFLRNWFSGPLVAALLSSIGAGVFADGDPKIPGPATLPRGEISKLHNNQAATNEELKEVSQKIEKIFFQLLEKNLDENIFSLYNELKSEVTSMKTLADPKKYLPEFSIEFKENKCISVADFSRELNKLTEQITTNPSLETFIKCLDDYHTLCSKDFNHRFLELCLKQSFEPYDKNFIETYKKFQNKISEQLIYELASTQSDREMDLIFSGKITEISNHLYKLHCLFNEHPFTQIFEYLPDQNETRQILTTQNKLTHFPELNRFLKEDLLPQMRTQIVLNGNQNESPNTINCIESILNLASVLNLKNASITKKLLLQKINSKLIDSFTEATLDPNPETQKESLLKLQMFLTPYKIMLSTKKDVDGILFLLEELETAIKLNPSLDHKKNYYRFLTKIASCPDSRINSRSLAQAKKDLVDVIQGTADKETTSLLKKFLAESLFRAASRADFDRDFQNSLVNANIELGLRGSHCPKGSLNIPVLEELLEVIANPDFLIKLPKHSNPAIAELFKTSSELNDKDRTSEIIKLNQRFANSWKFFAGIARETQTKFTYEQEREIFNTSYAKIRKRLALNFCSNKKPYPEFTAYHDPFTYGFAFGNLLEAQMYIETKTKSDQLIYHCEPLETVIANPFLIKEGINTNISNNPLPPIREMQSRLNHFLKNNGQLKNLNQEELNFVLGALSVPPDLNQVQIGLKQRLNDRYSKILESEILDNKWYFRDESLRNILVEQALGQ